MAVVTPWPLPLKSMYWMGTVEGTNGDMIVAGEAPGLVQLPLLNCNAESMSHPLGTNSWDSNMRTEP